jgi:uncharacterized protein (DUF1499 family)
MAIAWLAFLDSLMAVAMIGAGIFGAHYRWFPPFSGFQMFLMGFFLGFVALFMGLIGIFATRNPIRANGRKRAVVGTVVGLLVILPVLWMMFTGPKVPAINDITTDFDNSPEFTKAVQLNHGRDMKYDRAKYADRQLRGYGPLAPLKLPEPPDEAFQTVQRTAAQMSTWTITSTDAASRTLEGYATSGLFHFNDDFVIQVRADAGGGSLVEMRSKSRDGIGDFGVNYKRIKDYFAAVSPGAAS